MNVEMGDSCMQALDSELAEPKIGIAASRGLLGDIYTWSARVHSRAIALAVNGSQLDSISG